MNTQLILMKQEFELISEDIKKGEIENPKKRLRKLSDELLQFLQSLNIEDQGHGDPTYGDTLYLLGGVSQIIGHCYFLCGDYENAVIAYRDATQIFVMTKIKNSIFNGLRYIGSCYFSVMSPEYLDKHKKTLIGQYDATDLILEDMETYGRLLAIGYNVMLHSIPKEQLDSVLHDSLTFHYLADPYIDEYNYL